MEIVLSIIAIILSIVSFVFTYCQTKRINTKMLKLRFYEKIFDDYLIERIPKARKKIHFSSSTNKLIDAKEMRDVLSDLKLSVLYFKYANNAFYDRLIQLIDDLESYLSIYVNNQEPDNDKQSQVITSIGKKIEGIYSLIDKNANEC